MVRTDVHRPAEVIPADYEFVAFEHLSPGNHPDPLGLAQAQMEERSRIRAHMARTGGTYSSHAHGGNCMICGNANAIYTALFYHAKSNTYVRAGQDCTDKLDRGDLDFNAFSRRIKDHMAARAGKAKAQATLDAAGLAAAWAIYTAEQVTWGHNAEEWTIRDIVGKLVRYGSISERQEDFVRTLLGRIDQRAERAAQRAAEAANAQPWTAGRQVVEGTIVSVKSQESYYSRVDTLKMLVKRDDGAKIWTTVPSSALDSGERISGKRIRFTVTVEPKAEDPTFAFGSRPSKAELLEVSE